MKIKIKRSQIEKEPYIIWNKFGEFSLNILEKNYILNQIQKNAVLCYWYQTEMNSAGHSGYFDVFKDVNKDDLITSMKAIGSKKCAENFLEAIEKGLEDDYIKTDMFFYEKNLEFGHLLEEYVKNNISEFFDII